MTIEHPHFLGKCDRLTSDDVVTIDYETHEILPLPAPAPVPVGVAVKINGGRSEYLAWAHPTANNCWEPTARDALHTIYDSGCSLVFHNAKFDLEVGRQHLGLHISNQDIERVHDTMLLAFIENPNSDVLSLKPLADHYLDLPPDEQDVLRTWILENVAAARRAPTKWGAHIAKAPGRLVGTYARGDVDRTYKLFRKWRRHTDTEAYRREIQCIPMLLDMERRGVPVDVAGLENAVHTAEKDLCRVERWIGRWLCIKVEDLGKKEIFADALEDAGAVSEWRTTPTGKRSVSIANLREVMTDPWLLGALEYRALVSHQLSTFARPWLVVAKDRGAIYPSWNQVRQSNEKAQGRAMGTRTGRLSTTPNVQNVPAELRPLVSSEAAFRRETVAGNAPIRLHLRGMQLIDLRKYVAADVGSSLINFDYKQQELRILAHYAGGELLQSYLKNPEFDQHAEAEQRINDALGTSFVRKQIKRVGFGIIYAMGLDLLGESIGTDPGTAGEIRTAYRAAFPGMKDLEEDCKKRGAAGKTIKTWGGREYHVEPPSDGRTFEYKMLNRLIQGSAADVLKEVMLRYHNDAARKGKLVLTVHDEIIVEAPNRYLKREYNRLKRHMESVEFTLPMPVDGAVGPNWRDCK